MAAAAAEALRIAEERKKFTAKFYYGRKEDTVRGKDLNWKTLCAKEKKEMAQLERRKAEEGKRPGSTRQYHPSRSFGPSGSLATITDIPPRREGKSSKYNPMFKENTFKNIFPEPESEEEKRGGAGGSDSPPGGARRGLAAAGAHVMGMASPGPELSGGGRVRQSAPISPEQRRANKRAEKKLSAKVRRAKLQQQAAKERIARRNAERKARELEEQIAAMRNRKQQTWKARNMPN